MFWRIIGDVVTGIAIALITAFVLIIGIGIRAIHKHMMKD